MLDKWCWSGVDIPVSIAFESKVEFQLVTTFFVWKRCLQSVLMTRYERLNIAKFSGLEVSGNLYHMI
jgi:hypothetical protein